MTDEPTAVGKTQEVKTEETRAAPRVLPPAAQRALAEAQDRRRRAEAAERPPEQGGRAGPDPVRYGDWERNGIISDF